MPMQLGYGANNKPGGTNNPDALNTLGLSTWLTMTIVNNNGNVFSTTEFAAGTTFTGQNQRADINIELVPIPGALLLLLSGLASLGLMGWRRREAA